MRFRLRVIAMTALGMSGCVGQHKIPFSDADFARYAGDGPATVQGSALGRTRGGEPKTCAALPVYLAPATAYDREGISNLYTLDAARLAAGPAMKYWRKTACDVQGKFTFAHVPTGPWYVLTSIEYQILGLPTARNLAAGTLVTTEREGGLLVKEVNLRPGDNTVILTAEDLHTSPLSGLLH